MEDNNHIYLVCIGDVVSHGVEAAYDNYPVAEQHAKALAELYKFDPLDESDRDTPYEFEEAVWTATFRGIKSRTYGYVSTEKWEVKKECQYGMSQ